VCSSWDLFVTPRSIQYAVHGICLQHLGTFSIQFMGSVCNTKEHSVCSSWNLFATHRSIQCAVHEICLQHLRTLSSSFCELFATRRSIQYADMQGTHIETVDSDTYFHFRILF
jgi:hypothetical protein